MGENRASNKFYLGEYTEHGKNNLSFLRGNYYLGARPNHVRISTRPLFWWADFF